MSESKSKTEFNSEKPKFPTEFISLPSKGLLYPKDNPLASGKIEMKYMTAKEEDILTNQNYIKQGTVIDKLLQALIVSPINYDDLIVGDKNAIMLAARVLGYGAEYTFDWNGERITVDLSTLEEKPFDENLFTPHENVFSYTLPHSKNVITFKLLTHGDERKIDAEIKGLQKMNKTASYELSTRLKHMILSVNGEDEKKTVREFVDNYLLARDSQSFREYLRNITPDIDMTISFDTSEGLQEGVRLPMNTSFFWPDAGVSDKSF
jgi:hypothetical protein